METRKIDSHLIREVLLFAKKSKRKRFLALLSEQKRGERITGMVNAFLPGTYVCPHRHNDKYENEIFALLKGKAIVLIFDNKGKIDGKRSMVLDGKKMNLGIMVEAGKWHSVIALEPTVLLEVKGHRKGYVKEKDKEFASWAPTEEEAEAEKYLKETQERAKILVL